MPQLRNKLEAITVLSLLFSLLLVSAVHAQDVSLQNLNLTFGYSDLDLPQSVIGRTYNSQVSSKGIFGKGWCSTIETSLRFEAESKVTLSYCGAGQEVVFDIGKQTSIKSLRDIPKGTYKQTSDSKLVANGKSLEVHIGSDELHIFDLDGNCLKTKRPDLGEVNFIRSKKGLSGFRFRNVTYSLKFENGHVTEMKGGKQAATLTYEGDFLKSNKNVWGNSNTYSYNTDGLLNRIDYDDDSHFTVEYSDKFGTVSRYVNRDGCDEKFELVEQEKSFLTKATRLCTFTQPKPEAKK